jgi:hypothetical protein
LIHFYKSLKTFAEQGRGFFKMEVNEANLGQLAVYLQQTLSPQAEVNGFGACYSF